MKIGVVRDECLTFTLVKADDDADFIINIPKKLIDQLNTVEKLYFELQSKIEDAMLDQNKKVY